MLADRSIELILGIVLGTRSHKELKNAFDWERYPPSYRFWSSAQQARELPHKARSQLTFMLEAHGIKMKEDA